MRRQNYSGTEKPFSVTKITGIAALLLTGTVSVCAAVSVCAESPEKAPDAVSSANLPDISSLVYPLDEVSAQELALSDAGVDPADAERLRTKPEREDGEDVIEVEFYSGNSEYEYTIRAEDGMILEWQIEGRDVTDAVAELSLTGGSRDAAQESRTDAGTAAGTEAQTDEGTAAGTEAQTDAEAAGSADVPADAAGGAQTNAEAGAQTEFVTADGTALVGLEKAKDAVRTEAGSADGLTFAKIHFECGRRYYEYEFEVYAGGREYEYTVDAQTGEVLFVEMDD